MDTLIATRRSTVAAQSAALTVTVALVFCQLLAFMIEFPLDWSFDIVQIAMSVFLFAISSLPAHIYIILRRGSSGYGR
jgi:hypothetical protein